MPTFRTPDDCTPWVLGGLWPAELDPVTPETATVAEYLKRDLQRIADSANHKLRMINEARMPEPIRHAEQNRVIDSARAYAVARVESTMRQLRREPPPAPTTELPSLAQAFEAEPVTVATPVIIAEPVPEPEPDPPAETTEQRLRRFVDAVARQEPGLRWAAGEREDGSIVIVTDLAHGWIPPGIVVPAGVELLEPARRNGNLRALLGATDRSATYSPGDPFSHGSAAVPGIAGGRRTAAEVPDLGWRLSEATRWRDGLPRITHTLAKAAASGTGVAEAELDVLRVHLDTARYQLLARYPGVNTGILLNCLLLAATDALAAGDREAANYHFAWFVEFTSASAGNEGSAS